MTVTTEEAAIFTKVFENKTDEIVVETQKKEVLESYLPAMLSREQTEALIDETVAKL